MIGEHRPCQSSRPSSSSAVANHLFSRIARYPYPRPETMVSICERALKICPELVSSTLEKPATVENLKTQIVNEGCGLRPARVGGVRLEYETLKPLISGVKEVPMVYNYG